MQAWRRDRLEKDELIFKQLEERQALQRDSKLQRFIAQEELMRLREDVASYRTLERHDRHHQRGRDRNEEKEVERHRRARNRRSRRRRDFEH